MVVGGGFEPPKAPPSDLQSDPFDRSGTPPQFFSGADTPIRTEDFLITSEMLYQLSYIGHSCGPIRTMIPDALIKDRRNVPKNTTEVN